MRHLSTLLPLFTFFFCSTTFVILTIITFFNTRQVDPIPYFTFLFSLSISNYLSDFFLSTPRQVDSVSLLNFHFSQYHFDFVIIFSINSAPPNKLTLSPYFTFHNITLTFLSYDIFQHLRTSWPYPRLDTVQGTKASHPPPIKNQPNKSYPTKTGNNLFCFVCFVEFKFVPLSPIKNQTNKIIPKNKTARNGKGKYHLK